jgi:hypothetical protein
VPGNANRDRQISWLNGPDSAVAKSPGIAPNPYDPPVMIASVATRDSEYPLIPSSWMVFSVRTAKAAAVTPSHGTRLVPRLGTAAARHVPSALAVAIVPRLFHTTELVVATACSAPQAQLGQHNPVGSVPYRPSEVGSTCTNRADNTRPWT